MEFLVVVVIVLTIGFIFFARFILASLAASEEWKEKTEQDNSRRLSNFTKIKGLESAEFYEACSFEELELFEEYFDGLKIKYPELDYEYEYTYYEWGEEYWVTVHNVSNQLSKEIEEWGYNNISEKE